MRSRSRCKCWVRELFKNREKEDTTHCWMIKIIGRLICMRQLFTNVCLRFWSPHFEKKDTLSETQYEPTRDYRWPRDTLNCYSTVRWCAKDTKSSVMEVYKAHLSVCSLHTLILTEKTLNHTFQSIWSHWVCVHSILKHTVRIMVVHKQLTLHSRFWNAKTLLSYGVHMLNVLLHQTSTV
jgi:hypothetical protein